MNILMLQDLWWNSCTQGNVEGGIQNQWGNLCRVITPNLCLDLMFGFLLCFFFFFLYLVHTFPVFCHFTCILYSILVTTNILKYISNILNGLGVYGINILFCLALWDLPVADKKD